MKPAHAPALGLLILLTTALLIAGAALVLLAMRPSGATALAIATIAPTSTPRPTMTLAPTVTPPPTLTPTVVMLVVYVTGAVHTPNLTHTLPQGSRVRDAIDAAGGALPDADLARINLAAFVVDADQIHVYALAPTGTLVLTRASAADPLPTASDRELPTAPPTVAVVFPIQVNRATLEELMAVPGIGEVLAGRIIAYRDASGRISQPDALMQIEGIGLRTLEQIMPYLSFE